ncbi:hypothetical protein N431DRAFT_556396 [Stipitochalara longipes BDJ]|nr:hypothetical protein N431DRAFT_556396 [Stipitochalara longipes BDJ]
MSLNGQLKIQFIDLAHPAAPAAAESQRRAHSHAARVAHAKTRRLRTIKYQADRNAESSCHNAFKMNMDVVPSPLGMLVSHRRDPFGSLTGPLKPIEHFLLDHYMSAVIPRMRVYCSIVWGGPVSYLDHLADEWVGFAQTDMGLLSGLFLAASRHLSENHPQKQLFTRLAIQYKIACVRAVSEAISAAMLSQFRDSTVANVMMLAFDEFSIGNLAISRQHVHGAIKMVEHNGGPKTLGLNGFLERALWKIIFDTSPLEEAQPLF